MKAMLSSFTFDESVSAAEYDEFVTAQPTCNLLQSSKWADIKNTWDSRRTVLRDSQGSIVAAGLVLIRPLKFGYTMWYLPHGPILDYHRSNVAEVLHAYLTKLSEIARSCKAIFIKIDPPVALKAAPVDEFPDSYDEHALAIKDVIEAVGYQHQGFPKELHDTIQPRFDTVILCPEQGESVESVISKNTLKLLKKAQRRYVQVERVGIDRVPDFVHVLEMTEEKQGVRLRGVEYHERLLSVYGDDAYLYIASLDIPYAISRSEAELAEVKEKIESLPPDSKKYVSLHEREVNLDKQIAYYRESQKRDGDKVVLAGSMNILYGSGLAMIYSGMNRQYAKTFAQYLNHVQALRDAFDRGARYASMGGVSGSFNDSLFEYKKHFNPLIVEKLGEFDFPIHKLMYRALRFVLKHR